MEGEEKFTRLFLWIKGNTHAHTYLYFSKNQRKVNQVAVCVST